MTVLGVVSDTHLPRFGRALPRSLIAGLREANVERILHCGDMTELLVVELFRALAPFEAVAGNNDGDEIRSQFGRKKILTIEDVRIGMVHGDGKKSARPNAIAAFAKEDVDVICFGHSHWPLHERLGKTTLLNPGSPTDKRMNPLYSYAILRIEGQKIDAKLHYYLDRRTD